MVARKELAGERVGRLTVLRYSHTNKFGRAVWICRCSCGNITKVASRKLIAQTTKSCGCLAIDQTVERSTRHGMVYSPEYKAWQDMRQRCTNENRSDWEYYGGRGISVCDRWADDFASFYEDMGTRPSPKHSLDRIDNDGDYCPENCRWVTHKIQCRNRRSTKLTPHDVCEIRATYSRTPGNFNKEAIAKKYGISAGHVYAIINEHKWKELNCSQFSKS